MKDLRILVVDDFDTMQKIIRNILDDLGYTNIISASDGKKAYRILCNEKIDLIISDWNMPNMSGIDLLKQVRGASDLAHIPFIMVTAEGQKDHILDAIREKVTQYIIKPFTSEMLAEKIKFALKSVPES